MNVWQIVPNARGHSLSTWAAVAVGVLADKWGGREEEGRGGGITPQKGRCRHWGRDLGWEAADWVSVIVWDLAVSNYKKKEKCLSQHAPNTMNFDGRDLEWEFKALLKRIPRTVQRCVDLDLVFHCVHYLPKSAFCWMNSIFLTAVEFAFGRQNKSECWSCTKPLL